MSLRAANVSLIKLVKPIIIIMMMIMDYSEMSTVASRLMNTLILNRQAESLHSSLIQ